jgi:hypothetical protein
MRPKQGGIGQGELATLDHLKNDRELPRHARAFDAVIGRMFRHVEHLHAVREKRGAAFAKIQASFVDFSEQGQQFGC